MCYVFQLDQCADPKFCSFHKEYHPENSFSDCKRVISSVCSHILDAEGNMQEQPEDTNDDKEVVLNGTPSSRHVVDAYQCSQVILKMNIENKPQKQNDRYNLGSKGVPPTLGEM